MQLVLPCLLPKLMLVLLPRQQGQLVLLKTTVCLHMPTALLALGMLPMRAPARAEPL
jgi:hypothetical protein